MRNFTNFYAKDFKRNAETNLDTDTNRKRKMLVVGMLLDLQYSLANLARGKVAGGAYRKAMGNRAYGIINKELPLVIEKLGDQAPKELLEIQTIVKAVKLSGKQSLVAEAAASLEGPIAAFSKGQDGSALAGVDSLIPKTAKGQAWQP